MGQSPPGDTVKEWDGDLEYRGGLPFIQGNAEFGARVPRPLKWCVRPLKVAKSGDMLISVRAPVGETNRADQSICIGRGLAAIRFLESGRAFGWHIANHRKRALERLTQGSTFPAISGTTLRSLPILFPPLLEQRAIAAVLDSIDEAIEAAEAVVAATERLRDALLHRLLTRGVPGWHSEWKEVRGIGTIPTDWEVVRLGEVAEFNGSNWDPSDGSTILYLDLTSVVKPGVLGCPQELEASDAPSRARRRVHSGDILVSTVRPNLRGFARVSEAPDNLVASTGFAVVSPQSKVNSSFVYHNVMTTRFSQYLEKATTGQAYPAVKASDVAAFRLALPPPREQRAISAMLNGVDEAIERGRAETEMLQSLKASAADALLTGRVRVNEQIKD